jgi:hypothetical protein
LQSHPGDTDIPCDVTAEDSVAQAVSSVLRDFAEPVTKAVDAVVEQDVNQLPVLEAALEGRTLAKARFIGRYERTR